MASFTPHEEAVIVYGADPDSVNAFGAGEQIYSGPQCEGPGDFRGADEQYYCEFDDDDDGGRGAETENHNSIPLIGQALDALDINPSASVHLNQQAAGGAQYIAGQKGVFSVGLGNQQSMRGVARPTQTRKHFMHRLPNEQNYLDFTIDAWPDHKVLDSRSHRKVSELLHRGEPVNVRFPFTPINHSQSVEFKVRGSVPTCTPMQLLYKLERLSTDTTPLEAHVPQEAFAAQFKAIAAFSPWNKHIVPHTIDLESYENTADCRLAVDLCTVNQQRTQVNSWVSQNTISSDSGPFGKPELMPGTCRDCLCERLYVGYWELLTLPSWKRWGGVDYSSSKRALTKTHGNVFYTIILPSQTIASVDNPIVHEVLRSWPKIYAASCDFLEKKQAQGESGMPPIVEVGDTGSVRLSIPVVVLDQHMAQHEQHTNQERHAMCLSGVTVRFYPRDNAGWAPFMKYLRALCKAPATAHKQIHISATFKIRCAILTSGINTMSS